MARCIVEFKRVRDGATLRVGPYALVALTPREMEHAAAEYPTLWADPKGHGSRTRVAILVDGQWQCDVCATSERWNDVRIIGVED